MHLLPTVSVLDMLGPPFYLFNFLHFVDRLITPESSITSLDELTDLSFYELPSLMYQEVRTGQNDIEIMICCYGYGKSF